MWCPIYEGKLSIPLQISYVFIKGSEILAIEALVKGAILGFVIAAPVGPIGILCIRRTLAHGRWIGFVSGLGAATADGLYGLMAALGLTALTSFLIEQLNILQALGGLFLCYLAVNIIRAPAVHEPVVSDGSYAWRAYGSTFALTLTNPMTILSFIGIFSGLALPDAHLLLVIGVVIGSALWWFVLSLLASMMQARLNTKGIRYINYASGCILLLFGFYSLLTTTWIK